MIARTTTLALLLAVPLGAQTKAASNPTPRKTGMAQLVGVVLDSVNGGFLIGATIILESARKNAETDSAGRFTLDSIPPGTYQLGVFHPLLDALDISVATKSFHAGADSVSVVILSVPSPATIVQARCAHQNLQSGSSAIVGHVNDPETLAPVAGAEVSLAWTEIEISKSFGVRHTPHLISYTTDRTGAFLFCGLPSGLDARLKARREGAATGEIPVSLGNRPIEMQARNLLLSKQDSTTKSGHAVVSGVVLLEGNPPNAVSRVELEGTNVAVLTNDRGEFTLRDLPPGSRNILARHLGYAPQAVPVDLNPRERARVTLKLPKFVAVMDPIVVMARRNVALDKAGFNQRKKAGFGYFMDPEPISQMHANQVADILRMVPGLRVNYGPHNEPIVSSTRGSPCVRYVVDDVPFTELESGDINNFITGSEVVAVEVYPSGTAPPQYTGAGGACAVIVLWTRFRIGS